MARALHAETTTQPRGAGNAKIRRKTKSHSHRKHAASAKSQKNLVDDFDDEEGEEDDDDDDDEEENEEFPGKSNTANSKSKFEQQSFWRIR